MSHFDIEAISGVIPAMLTLFDENEEVDVKRTEALVDFLLKRDVDGFYLTGSTGEGFLMTGEERKKVVETVVHRVAGRKPVIVHIGDIGTKKSIDLAKHAYEVGADAVSSVPPFYWRFSEQNIYNYYKDIAEATPLPMIIYNVPLAGLMGTELILKLSQLENVKGLKFTGKDHDQMGHLKEILGEKFMIYSGCDEMSFSGLALGTDGIIGSFYNVMPELFKEINQAVQRGELTKGVRLQKIATEIILAALKYDYIALMRNMIKWQGVDAGYSRRPFTNYKDSELDTFKEALRQIKDKYHVTEVAFLKNI
ncbi:dihydrodipicolinate synthase family protein [Niameybacter massiliensis]|uniref:Dihydrodipicolinate synthase family protein n=1 Tax=Holtiella tumoricola TaxID=3018743 RepID=A0AA42DMY1_9FIRM|nr:dihydrodipicolinate synthase family protein [Holtiella tumoricola]MDA3731832.1 dihydrodipicolinate synthase family protein [Holtiella tumoricola]